MKICFSRQDAKKYGANPYTGIKETSKPTQTKGTKK